MALRAIVLLGLACLASSCGSAPRDSKGATLPVTPFPSERQRAWHDVSYYAVVRFGLSTFTELASPTGNESPGLFAPTALDCRQWARACRDAGMRGLVLVAKDTDGFCLWPTATTSHSVTRTAWKNGQGDVVREAAEACRLYGLAFGIALALEDRACAFHADAKRYDEQYLKQIHELTTGYGDLMGFWIGTGTEREQVASTSRYDWPSYCRAIRAAQPGAVIVSDLGPDVRARPALALGASQSSWSPAVLGGGPGAWSITAADAPASDRQLWLPQEHRTILRREGTEHSSQDEKVHSLDDLLAAWEASLGNNTAWALELSIDRRGLVPEPDAHRLREVRAALDLVYQHALANGSTMDGELEFTLAAPTEVDRVVLAEPLGLGQRVRAFVVEAVVDGVWRPIGSGTTIGQKRVVHLARGRYERVRVVVREARATPTPFQASLHLAPSDLRALAEIRARGAR